MRVGEYLYRTLKTKKTRDFGPKNKAQKADSRRRWKKAGAGVTVFFPEYDRRAKCFNGRAPGGRLNPCGRAPGGLLEEPGSQLRTGGLVLSRAAAGRSPVGKSLRNLKENKLSLWKMFQGFKTRPNDNKANKMSSTRGSRATHPSPSSSHPDQKPSSYCITRTW